MCILVSKPFLILDNFLSDLVQKRIGCSAFMSSKLSSLSFSDSLRNKIRYKQINCPDWLRALPGSEAPPLAAALHFQHLFHVTTLTGLQILFLTLTCLFHSQANLQRCFFQSASPFSTYCVLPDSGVRDAVPLFCINPASFHLSLGQISRAPRDPLPRLLGWAGQHLQRWEYSKPTSTGSSQGSDHVGPQVKMNKSRVRIREPRSQTLGAKIRQKQITGKRRKLNLSSCLPHSFVFEAYLSRRLA